MIIQHNIMAINSHRQLTINNNNLARNLEKLSSGYRINRAADDAAGLAISEKMRAQITGLDRAILNAKDGASLIQTAEGALTEVHSMLNRMVELATQSANGTIQTDDRQKIESELTALKGEIDRISKATNFNGINLLDGSLGGAVVGNLQSGQTITGGIINWASGATIQTHATSNTITATATTNSIVLSYYNTDGVMTTATVNIDPAAVPPNALFFNLDGSAATAPVAGGSAQIDLTSVGLGQLTLTFDSATTATLGSIATDLAALVNGAAPSGSVGLTMQVGDTADTFNKITVLVDNMSSQGIGIADISMLTQDEASAALDAVRSAIEQVSVNRGNLGALQNRLDHTINNLGVTSENMTAAESRIRDVDMAKEMMAFTKNNVLSQAAQAMLAQANQQPQQVLQLLR